MSKVDIQPLANAVARLEEALVVYRRDPSQTLIRDGLIQRFEFTYEIAHRTLKRYLVEVSPAPEVACVSGHAGKNQLYL